MSKTSRKSDRVLGVAATSRTVHAILLENGPDGPTVVRRFSRQRAVAAATGFEDPAANPAAKKAESMGGGDDFTIEFGDGSSSNSSLFLSSEFGGLEEDGDEESASSQAAAFDFELGDILSECSDAGYDDAALAFTLGAGDVTFAEIKVKSAKKQGPGREALLDALTGQHRGSFDDQRVAFIPMTDVEEDERRYLAVIPKKVDSVSSTLMMLRESTDLLPRVSLVGAEVPALLGLARAAKDAFSFHDDDAGHRVLLFDDDGEEQAESEEAANRDDVNTLVVRAGAEDTLVLFMTGSEPRHCEILRSLTAFDHSETICSRVLLQQDEHGIGEINHVLVLSEEREQDLADSFEVFFPDAKIELLRTYLPALGDDDEDASTALVAASAAALRALEDSSYAPSFEDINFLPKKLARRKVKMPVQWHVVVMSVMIVITTLFFMTRYSSAESELDTYRERLEEIAPEEVNLNITQLQTQIDSMQHLYTTYTRAIGVLDTLLIGSDRWSRILENASAEASKVRGLWIESFEQAGSSIKISGNATSRDEVVAFASRIEGTIESLVFSEIREWPVYTYAMQIPVSDSLPEAARYLRDKVKLEEATLQPTETINKNHSAESGTDEAKS